MRLQPHEKTDEMFASIKRISDESFTGVEVPPVHFLRQQFDIGDVFIQRDRRWPPVESGKVIAFAILARKFGEPYIWSLATDKAWRKKGLASLLLGEIDERVKEIPNRVIGIGLTTHVDNPAQKLYFDHGYRVKNVLDNFYFGADGLFMRKEIIC